MRTIPLTGTDTQRIFWASIGEIAPFELHTTNKYRAFLGNNYLGSQWHGSVLGPGEMEELNDTSARGVWPGDQCYREDTRSIWLCVANNGENANSGDVDWIDLHREPDGRIVESGYTMSPVTLLGRYNAGLGAIEEITVPYNELFGISIADGYIQVIGRAYDGDITDSGLTIGTGKIAGRITSGTGALEEIGLGTGLSFSGGNIVVSGYAPTGPVTSSGLTMNTNRLLGRITGGSGAIQEIVVGIGLALAGTDLNITTVPVANGGTGTISYTKGDILVATGATTLVKLNIGATPDGYVLTTSSGDIAGVTWAAAGAAAGIATDTFWAAKGDLAVGTGNNTASVLSVGTNDYYLTPDSSTGTGLKWAALPAAFNPLTWTGWAAKGDWLLGTGNDTAALLTVGSNGTIPYADSTQTTGVRWDTLNAGVDIRQVWAWH